MHSQNFAEYSFSCSCRTAPQLLLLSAAFYVDSVWETTVGTLPLQKKIALTEAHSQALCTSRLETEHVDQYHLSKFFVK